METLSPEIATFFAVTTGVGFLMLVSGIQKSALEWRRRRRLCASCGREIAGRVCPSCND
jgi:hypothetical protein